MKSYIPIITTTEKRKDAEKIADVLVNEKLAACVQIVGPITSIYWWKGHVEKAEEWQCLIKTRQDLYEEIEKTIKSLHPYDVPEMIALPLSKVSKDYLLWLDSVLI